MQICKSVNSHLAVQMISVCISRDCLIRFNFLVQHTINEVHYCYRQTLFKKKKKEKTCLCLFSMPNHIPNPNMNKGPYNPNFT